MPTIMIIPPIHAPVSRTVRPPRISIALTSMSKAHLMLAGHLGAGLSVGMVATLTSAHAVWRRNFEWIRMLCPVLPRTVFGTEGRRA